MFVVTLTYEKPLEEIDGHLAAHRAYLDVHFKSGVFLLSGPRSPRVGGVIIASGKLNRQALEAILEQDPFKQNGLARYDITEFQAARHQPALAELI